MVKILIADDHAVVREGLKQILASTTDLVIGGEASNSQQVLDHIRRADYDVVLLDISMPGRGGLEVLRQIKAEKPKLRVLMLSMHPEEQYAIRSLKAGAAGYLTKESAPQELVAAIRKVATGGKYVTPQVAEKLAYEVEDEHADAPHQSLSDREFQVLRMIASGKTVKEISEELFLSVKTISTYRSRLLQKMKMKNNAQLTHYAIQNHLVD